MNSKDNFGDRMKMYEAQETLRCFVPMLPVYARIDGRSFSRFTRGLHKPYDINMKNAMVETTKILVGKTSALIGYTQSDEISLVYYQPSYDSDILFKGKIFKLTSVLASLATSAFVLACMKHAELKSRCEALYPHFDCRVMQLPSKEEAANMILWRERDATKNAISSAARTIYSHNQVYGKDTGQMKSMLWEEGINFDAYPDFFKRGTFLRRVVESRFLTQGEREAIPDKFRPKEDEIVTRSKVVELTVPPFDTVSNQVGFIFDKEDPKVEEF